MYRENKKKWKGNFKDWEGRKNREAVRKAALQNAARVPRDALVEIARKIIAGEELFKEENKLLESMGRERGTFLSIVPSAKRVKKIQQDMAKGKEWIKMPETDSKKVVQLFEKKLAEINAPEVVVVKTTAPAAPAPATPVAPTVAPPATPAEPTPKGKVLWEGRKEKEECRPRGLMRFEEEPQERHDNLLWAKPKRFDFGRGQIEPAVPARSNGRDVWLVFSNPLEDKDLGYPRPIVIPWRKEAEFGNVFQTEIPAFSQETTEEGIVIVRSSVHFAQEVLQKKGPITVLFKGEEFCLIHVGDKKLRRRVEQELNHAQKETTGKNPWIVTRLGLLRSPEYRVPDEKVLEVLQTAVAAAEARGKKKVTVEKIETVTQNAEASVSA